MTDKEMADPPRQSATTTGTTAAAGASGLRQVTPAAAWACVGVVCLIAQGVVFGRWLAGGVHSARADYEISTLRAVLTWVGQAGMAAFLVGCTIVVWRQCRRARAVTFDAALVIGFGCAFWLEPYLIGREVLAVTNRYAVNVATWGPYLPSWHGSNPELQVHTLFAANMFMYFATPLWVWTLRGLLAPLMPRLAHWSTPKLVPVFVAAGVVADLLIEATLIPGLGIYAYTGANWDLSLFGGHWYQLPLIQLVLGGCLVAAWPSLMYHHATKNRITVQIFRGTEQLAPRGQTITRLLAGIGFANIIILAWELLTNFGMLLGTDPMPADTPSFMWPYR